MHVPTSADAPPPSEAPAARPLFLQAARHAADVLGQPAVADAWDRPSALEGWSVGGLAGHLARAVLTTRQYLAAPPPPADAPLVDAAAYFVRGIPDDELGSASDIARAVRARGDQEAQEGPAAVGARLREAVEEVAAVLDEQPADRVLAVLDGIAIPLDEYLLTRIVEVAVHADDLAASTGTSPSVPPEVLRAATGVLVSVSRLRHGDVGLLRVLARRERHPGPVAF